MKPKLKIIAALALGVALMGFVINTSNMLAQPDIKPKGKPWPVPEAEANKKNPLKSDPSVLKTGKEVWMQHCKSCHGAKGKGDGTKAAKIEISCGDFSSEEYQKQSDGALYWKTTDGRKPMPSFKDKLSDSERWAVILYSRTFAGEK